MIEKSGTWYSYNGERLGQGRDAARDFLKNNPKLISEVREKVLHMKGIHNKGSEAPALEEKAAPAAIANGLSKEGKTGMIPPAKAGEKERLASKAKH